MRHSDPSLTANAYTDPRLLDVRGALDALPALPLDAGSDADSGALSATGTDAQLAPMLAANLTIRVIRSPLVTKPPISTKPPSAKLLMP